MDVTWRQTAGLWLAVVFGYCLLSVVMFGQSRSSDPLSWLWKPGITILWMVALAMVATLFYALFKLPILWLVGRLP